MKQVPDFQKIERIEAQLKHEASARNRSRSTLLRRLKELHVFSTTFVPCFNGGEASPVDVERIGILAIALIEAAREEHRAMVADAGAQS